MKIGVLSPVWFAVPPSGYGGIEWIVSLLADGLVDAGHEVTLFASGDSNTKARLESVYPVAPSEWIGHTYWELRHAVSCLVRSNEFDVISDHTGLLGLALGSMGRTPFVHTVHGPVSGDPGVLYEQIVAKAPHAALVYKGAHRAVAIAIETGLPLKLAGARSRWAIGIRRLSRVRSRRSPARTAPILQTVMLPLHACVLTPMATSASNSGCHYRGGRPSRHERRPQRHQR